MNNTYTLCYCKKIEWCENCATLTQLKKEAAEKLETLEKENQLLRSSLQRIAKGQCDRHIKYDWRAQSCLDYDDKDVCAFCIAKETLSNIT